MSVILPPLWQKRQRQINYPHIWWNDIKWNDNFSPTKCYNTDGPVASGHPCSYIAPFLLIYPHPLVFGCPPSTWAHAIRSCYNTVCCNDIVYNAHCLLTLVYVYRASLHTIIRSKPSKIFIFPTHLHLLQIFYIY